MKYYKSHSLSVYQVLDILMAWLQYDWDNRKVYAINLLGRIRLGLIPPDKVVDVFESQLQELAECRTLYLDVMKYHTLGRKSFTSAVYPDKKDAFMTPRNTPSQVRDIVMKTAITHDAMTMLR